MEIQPKTQTLLDQLISMNFSLQNCDLPSDQINWASHWPFSKISVEITCIGLLFGAILKEMFSRLLEDFVNTISALVK